MGGTLWQLKPTAEVLAEAYFKGVKSRDKAKNVWVKKNGLKMIRIVYTENLDERLQEIIKEAKG